VSWPPPAARVKPRGRATPRPALWNTGGGVGGACVAFSGLFIRALVYSMLVHPLRRPGSCLLHQKSAGIWLPCSTLLCSVTACGARVPVGLPCAQRGGGAPWVRLLARLSSTVAVAATAVPAAAAVRQRQQRRRLRQDAAGDLAKFLRPQQQQLLDFIRAPVVLVF
jgi:hypothetical protein